MNKWEELFESWLHYCNLSIEENNNPDLEEDEGKYVVVDRELCWANETVLTAEDVVSAHPSIENEFLDTLAEDAIELALPTQVTEMHDDGSHETFYPTEAGYWAFLYKHQDLVPSESFKKFFKDKEWELQICELLAFHLEEVDLSNFI